MIRFRPASAANGPPALLWECGRFRLRAYGGGTESKIAAQVWAAVSAPGKAAIMPSDPRIRTAMHQLADTLSSPRDIPEVLAVLTKGAVEAIPGAASASISVRHEDGRLETLAPTNNLIEALDAEQYRLNEGPCYQIVTDETFLVSSDLAHDDRWTRFGRIAADAGFPALLAVLLTADGTKRRSALNVYASSPHEYDASSVEIAQLFASHASVAMGFVGTYEQLGGAITNRQIIGQAVGIVMERYKLPESAAFDYLVRVSQASNVKLHVVAADAVTDLNRQNELSRQG